MLRMTTSALVNETTDALIPHGWGGLDPVPALNSVVTRYDCEGTPTDYPDAGTSPTHALTDDARADIGALCVALWGMGELLPARSRARAKRRAARN